MVKLRDLIPELEIPSGKWVDMDMSQIDKEGMNHIWKVYSDAYSAQSLDFSANSASEMQSKYKAIKLIDVDKDKIPDRSQYQQHEKLRLRHTVLPDK